MHTESLHNFGRLHFLHTKPTKHKRGKKQDLLDFGSSKDNIQRKKSLATVRK